MGGTGCQGERKILQHFIPKVEGHRRFEFFKRTRPKLVRRARTQFWDILNVSLRASAAQLGL